MTEPALDAPERAMLTGYLDHYRGEVLRRASGLDRAQLAQPLAPSPMTLGGLVKHLTYVEIWWFAEVFAGEAAGEPWDTVDWSADEDWDWHSAADDEPAALLAAYDAACARSRAIAEAAELDDPSQRGSARENGQKFSLRWILAHMLEETARHAGHADLIRESVDGDRG